MRWTLESLKILSILSDGEWHYGLEIMEKTGIKSGTVYPILDRFLSEFHRYVRTKTQHQKLAPSKRMYRLNMDGQIWACKFLDDVVMDLDPAVERVKA